MLKYAVPKLIGGTGNQLFILSACIQFAEKTGRYVVFNKRPHNPHSNSSLADIFPNIPVVDTLVNTDLQYEISGVSDYTYTEIQDLYPDAKYILISGYCQHPSYIPASIHDYIQLPATSMICADFFIHIRRTDYVDNYIYGELSKYWKKCINHIPTGSSVIILSDDLEWANKHIPAMATDNSKFIKWIMLNKQISEFEVLDIMSKCTRGCICANSTLSWWGFWLGSSRVRKVFMPVPWSKYNTDIDLGLYVKGVQRISID